MRWLDKLKQGLKKTAKVLAVQSLDLEDLEERLIICDIGIDTTNELLEKIRMQKPQSIPQVRSILHDALVQKMGASSKNIVLLEQPKMTVILMVGVNGAGKTTSIGKLAQVYHQQGKTIAMIAADTFRAGAVEQLKKWALETHADFYSGSPNSDAAGLIFESLKQAQAKKTDIVFIDTAGRLQNRTDLMDELKKIRRVIQKIDPSMPHESILVLDATVGQNALSQVKLFNDVCPLSGLIMTKLDGTAKGGILVALANAFHLPIYAIGVGEKIDDLNPFDAEEYVRSLLGEDDAT